jgi:hypothetical protein
MNEEKSLLGKNGRKKREPNLERHVLEEVRSSIGAFGLIARTSVNPHTNCGHLTSIALNTF